MKKIICIVISVILNVVLVGCSATDTSSRQKTEFTEKLMECRKVVKMTQSLEVWLFQNHKDIYSDIMFGHTELLTDEIYSDYLEWCHTDEGKQYLQGGSKYDENHPGNKALDELRERDNYKY